MTKKTKRYWDVGTKKQAVEDYVSGRKSAAQIAVDLGVTAGLIYKWKTSFDEQAKGARVDELEAQGFSREQAKIIQQKDEEIAAYQKKVAEQAIVIDLLKKLRNPNDYQSESELTGLIAISKKLDRKKGPVK